MVVALDSQREEALKLHKLISSSKQSQTMDADHSSSPEPPTDSGPGTSATQATGQDDLEVLGNSLGGSAENTLTTSMDSFMTRLDAT